MAIELAADYYLINFRHLTDFVSRTYASLLTAEEKEFHSSFNALPLDAQKLYVRLLCRSKSIFRVAKLHYPDIEDLAAAVPVLSDAGFVTVNKELTAEDLLPLFTRAELLERVVPDVPRSAKRLQIATQILSMPDERAVIKVLMQTETIVQVLRADHFALYKLCFFGNLYQDMTDFVLRDIGMTHFEKYVIHSNNLAFQSRQQINAHLQYYACADQLDIALSESADAIITLHGNLPVATQGDANLKRRVDRLRNTLGRQLERIGELSAAMCLYQQSDRPPSRERQARVLVALERPAAALEQCKQILENPFNDEEKQFAEQYSARVAKSLKRDWSSVPRYRPPVDELELAQTGKRVELICAAHYAQFGRCFYTENTLFNAVYGLAFWDIIFAPIKGVFFNPFQHAPADFYEPDFVLARQAMLTDRWAQIQDSDTLAQIVLCTFESKQGIQNPMVHWQYLPLELLQLALSRIPLADWLCILTRLQDDLRHNRNGFPDLVLFPDKCAYCLIEVKGPGDTLQKNQLRWMACFARQGIAHKVGQITWSPDRVGLSR